MSKERLEVIEALSDGRSLVSASIREVIPTAKYANIEIFGSVTNVVDDAAKGLEYAFEKVEEGREAKRDQIIEELESGI